MSCASLLMAGSSTLHTVYVELYGLCGWHRKWFRQWSRTKERWSCPC